MCFRSGRSCVLLTKGKSTLVRPENITRLSDPMMPEAPEIKLPGGWLLAFTGMNAGSANANNPDAGAMSEAGNFTIRPPGPIVEAFQIEVTTRPMINLVWLGTLFIFTGGLIGMRRRILENRSVPIPDLPLPEPMGRENEKSPYGKEPSTPDEHCTLACGRAEDAQRVGKYASAPITQK